MLKVKTYVAPSKIHGIGLFAAESIKKGTIVWQWGGTDDMRTMEEVERMPEVQKQFWLLYGFVQSMGCIIMCGDNARFINHSCRPNLKSKNDASVAIRDIAVDEEITEDYRTFDKRELLFIKDKRDVIQ